MKNLSLIENFAFLLKKQLNTLPDTGIARERRVAFKQLPCAFGRILKGRHVVKKSCRVNTRKPVLIRAEKVTRPSEFKVLSCYLKAGE